MTTVDTSRETYVLTCSDCGHEWRTLYEVRHTSDLCECEMTAWFVDGHCVDSPWAGTRCPRCEGLHVRVLPSYA